MAFESTRVEKIIQIWQTILSFLPNVESLDFRGKNIGVDVVPLLHEISCHSSVSKAIFAGIDRSFTHGEVFGDLFNEQLSAHGLSLETCFQKISVARASFNPVGVVIPQWANAGLEIHHLCLDSMLRYGNDESLDWISSTYQGLRAMRWAISHAPSGLTDKTLFMAFLNRHQSLLSIEFAAFGPDSIMSDVLGPSAWTNRFFDEDINQNLILHRFLFQRDQDVDWFCSQANVRIGEFDPSSRLDEDIARLGKHFPRIQQLDIQGTINIAAIDKVHSTHPLFLASQYSLLDLQTFMHRAFASSFQHLTSLTIEELIFPTIIPNDLFSQATTQISDETIVLSSSPRCEREVKIWCLQTAYEITRVLHHLQTLRFRYRPTPENWYKFHADKITIEVARDQEAGKMTLSARSNNRGSQLEGSMNVPIPQL